MIQVRVDGNTFSYPQGGMKSLGDVVELVKASIDPEHIIIDMLVDGGDVKEVDWRIPLAAHQNRILEITTGTKTDYVMSRLVAASELCEQISRGFGVARQNYQAGMSFAGNSSLSGSVANLQAFLGWYQSILQVCPEKTGMLQKDFSQHITVLQAICELLVQQQISQSWWALADSIESKLEPELGRLGEMCKHFELQCLQ